MDLYYAQRLVHKLKDPSKFQQWLQVTIPHLARCIEINGHGSYIINIADETGKIIHTSNPNYGNDGTLNFIQTSDGKFSLQGKEPPPQEVGSLESLFRAIAQEVHPLNIPENTQPRMDWLDHLGSFDYYTKSPRDTGDLHLEIAKITSA